jgi:hypothetical protein
MQNMPEEELMDKEAALAAEVERLLPDFVNSCRDKADVVIIHQDAFAADYQDPPHAFLWLAINREGEMVVKFLWWPESYVRSDFHATVEHYADCGRRLKSSLVGRSTTASWIQWARA